MRRRAVTAGALLVLAAHSCALPDGRPAHEQDGGLDAGPLDAGADAARDAQPDAARIDGGPDDPGWIHLALVPDECSIDIAQHPERLRPRVTWADCGEGCRVYEGEDQTILDAAWSDAGRRYTVMRYAWEDERGTFVVLELDEAVPKVAVRFDARLSEESSWCSIYSHALGPEGLSVTAGFLDYDESGDVVERAWWRVVTLPLEDPLGAGHVAGERVGSGLVVDGLQAGDGFVAANTAAWAAWRVAGGVFTNVSGALHPTPVHNLLVAGRAIVWESWGATVGLAAWSDVEPARIIREVEAGDVRGVATDGTTIAWQEGTGYTADPVYHYTELSLWTGTLEGGALRDVRRVGPQRWHTARARLGGGLYAQDDLDEVREGTDLALYRLSDGARAEFEPPDGASVQAIHAVSQSEVLFTSTMNHHYRVDPRTLTFAPP